MADWVSPLASTLSSSTSTSLVYAAALAAVAYVSLPSPQHRAVANLPRPKSTLPVVGNTIDAMFTKRKKLHDWIYEECLRHQGKPFVIQIPGKPPMVVVSTVEAVEDILKTQFDSFGKGADFAAALEDVFGTGILASDGAKWHNQRKTASALFSMSMMRDIMDDVMVEHTERLCEIVGRSAQPGSEPLDIKHTLELYATDVFTKIGFGVDLHFLTSDNHEFFERFGRANHNLLYRNEQPTWLWQLKQALRLGVEKQQLEDVAWLDRFVYKIINDSIARRNQGAAHTKHKDLVALCLDNPTMASDEHGYDLKEIRDMAISFISAGRDTTAYTMAWVMVMLARYPSVQERIRQEIRDRLPELARKEIPAPRKDQVATLTYLEAVIKETLRLNAIIPLNTRATIEDVTLQDGTFLRAGTMILIPAYAMGRLPWIWGNDATEFKPERWIDPATNELVKVSPFKFIPFSAGPRICLGRQFSMMEMKIAISTLVSRFSFETTKDATEFAYDSSLVLGIDGPVLVRPTPVV
ncbi:hypothetical protein Poli38472_011057 [Pythium oligandrum]|uniref:Cytochrome P450 n=1 Tax=Pythium oligandrum TaxID=41045 RepID=A0A8K1CRL7_PYTOL|nr:hypothetical protein Poli38472_011057 [Pythium oligandrum]|eukprot:TMW67437.1 hypothetical protein Poli38472_011057 [Pythium oligandrum]